MRFSSNLILSILTTFLLFSASHAHQSEPTVQSTLTHFEQMKQWFNSPTVQVAPESVSCQLSSGTKTQCISIKVLEKQTEHEKGPWCPRNISNNADQAGIWFNEGKVHDADGNFIKNLATFYNDRIWQLYDPETGNINVTDSKEACRVAARPNVDPRYYNYCVECRPEFFTDLPISTYLIPLHTIPLKEPKSIRRGIIGVAYNGVNFDGPAPVADILGAHTLAPFDDCGGHVNPHVGYHYHAVRGCTKEVKSENEHAPMVGYTLDGFGLYTQLNADGSTPKGLDECRGHKSEHEGYHYHAGEAGGNSIIPCFTAEQGCVLEGDQEVCEFKRRRPPPRREHPPHNG